MHIGFLLNHHALHQVPHCIPYACVLSQLRPDWHIHIMCSTAGEAEFASEICSLYPGQRCEIERLHVPAWTSLAEPVAGHFTFLRKPVVQKANIDRFAAMDAIVVPELTSLALRKNPKMKDTKFIFTGHGAGDVYHKNVGMLDPLIKEFDLIMLPGRKIARELLARNRFNTTPYALAGYPKFEIRSLISRQNYFKNDRLTVLYNPTQTAAASSWYRFGPQVLDYFLSSEKFNLIFAPHVLLFTRRFTRGSRLPRKYQSTDHMKIDTGSRASCDMTYLSAADLYLGDLSSQIYEFIAKPRPAVFLNPLDEMQKLPSWSFGPVVNDISQLDECLHMAIDQFSRYRPIQEAACLEQYVQSDIPASKRGATIIAEFLETGQVKTEWSLLD